MIGRFSIQTHPTCINIPYPLSVINSSICINLLWSDWIFLGMSIMKPSKLGSPCYFSSGFIARIDDLAASLTTEGTGMYWYLMLIYSNRWEDWGKQQLDALCLSFSWVLSIDIHRFTTNPCMACNGMYIIVHTYMHLWSFIHLYIDIYLLYVTNVHI